MGSFLLRWVSRDPMAGASEVPDSEATSRIALYIPYTLLVYPLVRVPGLGHLARGE